MRSAHELPGWLAPQAEALTGMLCRGLLPQSLLIHGIVGTGRSWLAHCIAARLLEVPVGQLMGDHDAPEQDGTDRRGHPDFLLTVPAPDKTTISVDQIRDLIRFMQLKSHQGGARVALLMPAEVMTPPAANALLKTLEEPPPGSTIILVSARLSPLPATIVSRCHRLRVAAPPRQTALAWLDQCRPEVAWPELLDYAGGAPLLALSLERAGLVRLASDYAADIVALQSGRHSAVSVAQRWANGDIDLALRWLYWRAAHTVRTMLAPAASGAGALQSAAKASKISALFAYLRAVEQARHQRSKALNMQLQLGALLAWWSGNTFDRESEA